MDTFTIADVAHIHGIAPLKQNGGEVFAVCPFCGDARGKFSYVIEKGSKRNIYNCFVCGAHGDSIDLHINLSTGDYAGSDGRKRAARDIFHEINGDNSLADFHRAMAESIKIVNEVERSSDEACSKVYYALLRKLVLNHSHKEDLLRRGLTEEQIKRFLFKSVPTREEKYRICKELTNEGYSLFGVPGFYTNKYGKWDIKFPGDGYLCPVYDGERNLILGFQVRMDNPKNGTKYLWLSSSGRENGVGSGSPSTYLPGRDDKTVVVTEGILKATVVYCLLNGEVSVIGVPGVNSISGCKDYLHRFGGDAFILECYDMDRLADPGDDAEKAFKIEKLNQAWENLCTLISEYNLPYHNMKWDVTEDKWNGEYKGLDDFLFDYPYREKFLAYIQNMSKKELGLRHFLSE